MPQIAAHFVREIRSVQAEGPYFLGGTCVGAAVAFEMAQQLRAAGQQVAMLAMLESAPPSVHRASLWPMYLPPALAVPAALGHGILRLARALARLKPRHWGEHLRSKWAAGREIIGERHARAEDASAAYTDLVTRANYWAMFRYFPKAYPGPMALFLANGRPMAPGRDVRLDWLRYSTQDCPVHYSGGGDSGLMLTRPHVAELAQNLERELALARARSQTAPR
jgi:thioesterase domain-containing protein